MAGKINTFFVLSRPEKKFFLQALYLLALCRIKLRIKPIQSLLQEINKRTIEDTDIPTAQMGVKRIVILIQAAKKLVPYSTCLSQALAGHLLFFRQGYQTQLHVGVKKGKSFEAHAWLTLHDQVILGDQQDIGEYKEMPLDII